MSAKELRTTLRDEGVVLLRDFFAPEPLTLLRAAATRCFEAIESGQIVPERYRYNRHAHSVLLTALLDFGIDSEDALSAPLSTAGIDEMFSGLMQGPWRCRLEHSWTRKKFAPRNAPADQHIQGWHQDGALGAQFPPVPGPAIPPTMLGTCWIPLHACGRQSPGLEFIRETQPALLHFTELNDAALRQRFGAAAFWAPALEFGDGIVFRNDLLHRTYVHPEMSANRISVEYRLFPEGPV